MDAATHLAALEAEGNALAEAAEGHLDTPVATCPEWDMGDLVAHMARVHAWVRVQVEAGRERVPTGERPTPPDDRDILLDWYRSGLADLVKTLTADPETPAWTFSSIGPHNIGWWRRRQSLETAVHRWDAQSAAGPGPAPIDAALAVEGIDELVVEFLPGLVKNDSLAGLAGSLHLHATDFDGEWWIDFDPATGVTSRREHAKADSAVRGPASDLYLWLWNRHTADAAGLEVFGDTTIVDAWRSIKV